MYVPSGQKYFQIYSLPQFSFNSYNLKLKFKIETVSLLKSIQILKGSFGALRTSLSWRLLPSPRWNKAYREAQDSMDILLDFGKKHIQMAENSYESTKTDPEQMSVLKKMIRRCDPGSSYPLVMALGT